MEEKWSRQREQNVQRPRSKREHTLGKCRLLNMTIAGFVSRGIVTKEARASL